MNGAPTREILSWDYLVEWQAEKTYRELCKSKPKPQSEFAKRWEIANRNSVEIGTEHKLKLNRRMSLFYLLTILGDAYRSKAIRRLPRWLAYPTIRTSFFLVVFAYHWIGKIMGRPTFAMYKDRPTPERYTRPDRNNRRLDRSLRSVVHARRLPIEGSTGQAREKLLIGNAN